MSLYGELQRRNVFRAVVAYLALAGVVVQATDIVVPALNLPSGLVSIVVWVGVIGFPFVLVFSWAFEMTPEGLKRERSVHSGVLVPHVTARRLDLITIGFVVIAIALFALDRALPAPRSGAPASAIAEQPAPVGEQAMPGSRSAAQPFAAPDDKSIAVLPFVNMSSDPEQEYFSDGISEELLNLLAQIPELRVIARTSSFLYKGKELDTAEIADKLHVAHVLEGSVRKSGNMVRITAQLIRTSDSTHLWSESYDRPLTDVFAIQDEIARAVVAQLRLRLLDRAPRTIALDSDAHNRILRGNYLLNRGTPEDIAKAVVQFEQAAALAPESEQPWVGLAWAYNAQASEGGRPGAEAGRLAREAAARAFAIAPDSAKVHDRLGAIALMQDHDLPAAARHFAKGLELDPLDPDLLRGSSALLAVLGRTDASIRVARRVVALDPLNANAHSVLADVLLRADQWDASMEAQRASTALSSSGPFTHYGLGIALLMKGNADAALAEFREEANNPAAAQQGLALAFHTLNRHDEFERALAEVDRLSGSEYPAGVAAVYAWAGQADSAFAYLDRATLQGDAFLEINLTLGVFRPIHDDRRWIPYLRTLGRAPEQLAAIDFEVNLPP